MVGISASYYSYVKSKIYTESNEIKIKTVDKKSEDEVNYKEVEGITNVLLVGTDGRDVNEKARADSIIIATLDNNNKEIRLTSLFRDTLVDIEGYGPHKLNAAMAFGGIDLLKDTIQETYDISIDKYIIINEFDLINTIHKIDLVFIEELTKKELVENIDKEGVEIKWEDLKKENKTY